MKIVHASQLEIAKKVKAFIKKENKRPMSRKTCTIVAFKKGTNDTTIQTIKRAPKRVTTELKGTGKPTARHLVPFYNPKAVDQKTNVIGAYRCVVTANIISAKIDGVMYVAEWSNAL